MMEAISTGIACFALGFSVGSAVWSNVCWRARDQARYWKELQDKTLKVNAKNEKTIAVLQEAIERYERFVQQLELGGKPTKPKQEEVNSGHQDHP